MNNFDWESLEKDWGFLFDNSFLSKLERNLVRVYPHPEEIVISVYAYDRFGHLLIK